MAKLRSAMPYIFSVLVIAMAMGGYLGYMLSPWAIEAKPIYSFDNHCLGDEPLGIFVSNNSVFVVERVHGEAYTRARGHSDDWHKREDHQFYSDRIVEPGQLQVTCMATVSSKAIENKYEPSLAKFMHARQAQMDWQFNVLDVDYRIPFFE